MCPIIPETLFTLLQNWHISSIFLPVTKFENISHEILNSKHHFKIVPSFNNINFCINHHETDSQLVWFRYFYVQFIYQH